ncbi:FAD-binding oxidoreductase [Chelatococcus sp. SYSU_G07232]|uniref:FAD-binding oxidoreductase n=1 Tax=Chelatococcus albus TaxID=3047466 RepID=A0ABT7AKR3_9HYPH|nr:FAD-binding oxidoreductase [Chelatococcus sp. SYSU_G07232]MDJ1159950.1 FAD-binding oxidoreductase [Chelatococcus sp. SYSU_G07232]
MSLYEASAPPPAPRPALVGAQRADVCIVGAGLTGLGAALTLAEAGTGALVIEAERVGAGASGVNGGQIHPGQRRDQSWLEARLGEMRARALWDLAEEARGWVDATIVAHAIPCERRHGLLHLAHRPGLYRGLVAEAEHLARRYGVAGIELFDAKRLPEITGAVGYVGGVLDPHHGGHVDPLALTRGLAAAAEAAGARIAETSPVTEIERQGAQWLVRTPEATVTAQAVIVTGDGTSGRLHAAIAAHVMPLVNFMIATEPLGARADRVLKGAIAASDTKHVVNYFRRTGEGRLIFGGGESYGARLPAGFPERVRRRMLAIFPMLAKVRIEHAWGGTLGITAPRLPYVRQIEPGLYAAAGYSGQGVMLGPYTGRAIALAIGGDATRFDLLAGLPVPPLPGGRLLRRPLLVAAMIGFGFLDRL